MNPEQITDEVLKSNGFRAVTESDWILDCGDGYSLRATKPGRHDWILVAVSSAVGKSFRFPGPAFSSDLPAVIRLMTAIPF